MEELTSLKEFADAMKSLVDVAKGLTSLGLGDKGMARVSAMNSAVIGVQSLAMTIQSEHMALVDRAHQLENEIAALKQWDINRDDYELIMVGGKKASVYKKKISPDAEGEVHWFCQKCFENKRKSSMQPKEFIPTGLYRVWACSVCGENFQIEANYSPAFLNLRAPLKILLFRALSI